MVLSDRYLAVGRSRLHGEICRLVAELVPVDMVEEEHRRRVLAWLAGTGDVFRRVKPGTPSPHLVSYFLLADLGQGRVLLIDHRKAGLWLPTGGPVEPGEHPAATVRREAWEELGIEARFCPVTGEKPLFVTITQTAQAAGRHTDVSLWYVLSYGTGEPLTPDPGEFREARWWTRAQIKPEFSRADAVLLTFELPPSAIHETITVARRGGGLVFVQPAPVLAKSADAFSVSWDQVDVLVRTRQKLGRCCKAVGTWQARISLARWPTRWVCPRLL